MSGQGIHCVDPALPIPRLPPFHVVFTGSGWGDGHEGEQPCSRCVATLHYTIGADAIGGARAGLVLRHDDGGILACTQRPACMGAVTTTQSKAVCWLGGLAYRGLCTCITLWTPVHTVQACAGAAKASKARPARLLPAIHLSMYCIQGIWCLGGSDGVWGIWSQGLGLLVYPSIYVSGKVQMSFLIHLQ